MMRVGSAELVSTRMALDFFGACRGTKRGIWLRTGATLEFSCDRIKPLRNPEDERFHECSDIHSFGYGSIPAWSLGQEMDQGVGSARPGGDLLSAPKP